MKKILFFTVVIFLIILSFTKGADARQGCCSHHGGVCGCGCCDGSPLSATCAPYYPECGSNSNNEPEPIEYSEPVIIKTPAPVQSTPTQSTPIITPAVSSPDPILNADISEQTTASPSDNLNSLKSQTVTNSVPVSQPVKRQTAEPLNDILDGPIPAIKTSSQNLAGEDNNQALPLANQLTASSSDRSNSSDGASGAIIFWGFVGFGIYLAIKKKQKKNK